MVICENPSRSAVSDPEGCIWRILGCPAAGGIFQPQGWQGGLPRERHMLREAYSGNTHVGVAHRRHPANVQPVDTGVDVSSAGGMC